MLILEAILLALIFWALYIGICYLIFVVIGPKVKVLYQRVKKSGN